MTVHGLLPLLALSSWAIALATAALQGSPARKQQTAGSALAVSVMAAAFFGNGVGLTSVSGLGLGPILVLVAPAALVLCWILVAGNSPATIAPRPMAPLVAITMLSMAVMAPRLLAGQSVSPVLFVAILQLLTAMSRRIEATNFGKGLWVGLGLSLALGVALELTVRVVGPEAITGEPGYAVMLDLVGIQYRVGNALGGPAPFAFIAVIWMVMAKRYLTSLGWALASFATVLVVLATAARSGFVLWVMAVGVLALTGGPARTYWVRLGGGVLVGLGVLGLAVSSLTADQREGLSTGTGRLDLWNWIVEELFAGSGWYRGLGNWPSSVGALGAPWDAAHAHSLYLGAWWTLGLSGLALVVFLMVRLLQDGRYLVGSQRVQYLVLVSCFAVWSLQEPALTYGPTVGVSVMALVAMAVQSQTGGLRGRAVDSRTQGVDRAHASAALDHAVEAREAR